MLFPNQPPDFGDELAKRQLDLPLTDETSVVAMKMKKVIDDITSHHQTPPHIQRLPQWPPRPNHPPIR